jgi:hypothetical protein
MKNPAPYLRRAFKTLLTGQITYSSATVPVYEGEGVVATYQILIKETDLSTGRRDKHSFSGFGTQLIEVIHEGQGKLFHKDVDAIGELVMNKIQPAPRTNALSVSEFQVLSMVRESQNYLDEHNGTSFITRLLLRYSFYINQINL